jgi:hypothetical protein
MGNFKNSRLSSRRSILFEKILRHTRRIGGSLKALEFEGFEFRWRMYFIRLKTVDRFYMERGELMAQSRRLTVGIKLVHS